MEGKHRVYHMRAQPEYCHRYAMAATDIVVELTPLPGHYIRGSQWQVHIKYKHVPSRVYCYQRYTMTPSTRRVQLNYLKHN